MARLRVASPGESQPEAGFADTARAALDQVLAEGAVALVILYETPAEHDWIAVPPAEAVARGLVDMQRADFEREAHAVDE